MLISLVFPAAALAIALRYKSLKYYPLAKIIPLTILLIIYSSRAQFTTAESLVFSGLMCGLFGDVLLTFPRGFIPGLVAFLGGHILYSIAFCGQPYWPALLYILPWTAFMSFFLSRALLRQGRRALVFPVILYVAVSSFLIFSACSYSFLGGHSRWIVVAAVLFGFSDSVLAWNKFVQSFKPAQFFILSTYFAAQALIALYF